MVASSGFVIVLGVDFIIFIIVMSVVKIGRAVKPSTTKPGDKVKKGGPSTPREFSVERVIKVHSREAQQFVEMGTHLAVSSLPMLLLAFTVAVHSDLAMATTFQISTGHGLFGATIEARNGSGGAFVFQPLKALVVLVESVRLDREHHDSVRDFLADPGRKVEKVLLFGI